MSELKIGFLVNAQYAKESSVAQKLHLLIVRVLLYYCYEHQNILWGYHLFRSGRVDTSYRKISPQNIALKPAQKLLSDLVKSVSDKRTGKHYKPCDESSENSNSGDGVNEDVKNSQVIRSWEEVLTLLASNFSWDEDSENMLFVLTSSLLGNSDRIRSLLSSLKKDRNVHVTYIDIGYLEGAGTGLERECLDEILRGKYPEHVACVIPSDLLSCDLAFHWFRQMFKALLLNKPQTHAKPITFEENDVIVVLDDSNEEPCEFPSKSMTFQLFPLDENLKKSTDITKLKLKCEVVFSEVIARFLDNNNCYFVVFDEKFRKDKTSDFCSFLVEAEELVEGKQQNSMYYIKHLSNSCGVMFSMLDSSVPVSIPQLANSSEQPKEKEFDLLSFHDVTFADVTFDSDESLKEVVSRKTMPFKTRHSTSEIDDTALLNEIKDFHDLHINDIVPGFPEHDNASRESSELDEMLPTMPTVVLECAADEAMTQTSPKYFQRENVAGLIRKHQNDVKLELMNPTQLKGRHPDKGTALVKEHKIQVVLHLVWYSEFSSLRPEDMEKARDGVLALLRSISFLTSPNEMFKFLNDQILEEFHGDCGDLLRDLYDNGFLMELPDILCLDSNSLNSSVFSTHTAAPLYCEDTSSQSTNDPSSQSTFTRQRSWMDPSQLSQSSFSITVPKSKKKKKKQSHFVRKERDDPDKIAAMVCSQKQSGAAPRHLSSDTTPDEVKQSSKRRKFTRKNSVLDTPLKKQVKNPTTAKSSRARQRVDVTPKKCTTSVVHIQESPVRGGSSRASSFFGSQAQPPAMRSCVVKDGFKTPTRPPQRMTPTSSTEDIPSLFRSPEQCRHTPPQDSQQSSQYSSQHSSQHSFTPPGTPKSGRNFVKKLSYNSPIRTLFASGTFDHVHLSPKRKPLDSDYIQMKASPGRNLLEKENDPFLPSLNFFDEPEPMRPTMSEALTNVLEPIFNPRLNEDAQMPSFQSSPCYGTLNLQSKGGFLKLLEESSMSYCSEKKCDSDNESDVSAASSSYKSILKSPFNRHNRRKKRSVSFSLDAEVHFSSDNESESSRNNNILNLLNLVDGSINNDVVVVADSILGCDQQNVNDKKEEKTQIPAPSFSDMDINTSFDLAPITNKDTDSYKSNQSDIVKNMDDKRIVLDGHIAMCDKIPTNKIGRIIDTPSKEYDNSRKRKHSESPTS